MLAFPELKLSYPRGRIDPTTGERRQGGSYQRDVWLFLETWGFRTLNDLHGDDIAPPPLDLLAELFADHLLAQAVTHDPYDGRGSRGSISTHKVLETAHRAAEHVLRDWTPDWIEQCREWGRRGGKAGAPRKATKNTDANYARFLRLPRGLTREQQAKRLRLKVGIIDVFRARQRREDPFWDLL